MNKSTKNFTEAKFITPNWSAPKNIKALCTTRQGGCSTGCYTSFNLAAHVGDDPVAVKANRQQLITAHQLPNTPLWLQQTHSNQAVHASEYNPTQAADASYTQTKNMVCVVMTADCLPILICNQQGTEVAAIHAGWRGLAAGIIESTLTQLNSPPQELMAWFGPAISHQVFEVGDEVRQAFLSHDTNAQPAFTPQQNKWLADLNLLAKQRLQALGVTEITGGNHCTYTNESHFFSHRRDGTTGRMANLIWIDEI